MWCVGDLPSFPGFWRLLIDLALMLPRQLTNKNSEQRMKKTVPLISKTQIPSTEIETKWGNYTKIPVIIFLTKLLGSTLVLYHVICCTKWFQVCARNPKIDWNVTNHFINFRVRLSCSFIWTVYWCCWRKNWCFFFSVLTTSYARGTITWVPGFPRGEGLRLAFAQPHYPFRWKAW